MILLSLILSLVAHAAPAAPWTMRWEASVDGKPRAAFFDAGKSSALVAVETKGGRAELRRFSLSGKPSDEVVAEAKGEPGPVRVYGDAIFWIVDGKLLAFGENGRAATVAKAFDENAPYADVTVQRGIKPVAVGAKGLVSAEKLDPAFAGATGIYQHLDDLHVLAEGRRLQKVGAKGGEMLCEKACRWLELSSDGAWLTVEGKRLLRRSAGKKSEPFLEFTTEPGRPAYVFQKDQKDDLILVPFPDEGKLRAYRAP